MAWQCADVPFPEEAAMWLLWLSSHCGLLGADEGFAFDELRKTSKNGDFFQKLSDD